MFAQFLIVQIVGSVFAAYCSPTYAIGTDIIIMGFLGTLHAIYAWDWENKGDDYCKKLCGYLCIVALTALVVVFMVIASAQYVQVATSFGLALPDLYGCIGGFVTGLFSSFMFLPKTLGNAEHVQRQKCLKIAGVVATIGWAVLWVILLVIGGEIKKGRDFSKN